ncbi:zf-TFIIB domain-containing protein [Pirellulaceae bacterium SH501]
MKCPSCSDSQLLIAERKGIEIDYCPHCRGVWLDRGERDKFILQSEASSRGETHWGSPQTESLPSPSQYPAHRAEHRRRYEDDDDDDDRRRYPHPKKRKSFWGEIFDFD